MLGGLRPPGMFGAAPAAAAGGGGAPAMFRPPSAVFTPAAVPASAGEDGQMGETVEEPAIPAGSAAAAAAAQGAGSAAGSRAGSKTVTPTAAAAAAAAAASAGQQGWEHQQQFGMQYQEGQQQYSEQYEQVDAQYPTHEGGTVQVRAGNTARHGAASLCHRPFASTTQSFNHGPAAPALPCLQYHSEQYQAQLLDSAGGTAMQAR